MKLTPRFLITAIVFLVALLFGLSQISMHFGQEAALVAGLLVLSIPMALNPPSHVLGAAATAARNTDERPGELQELPVAASTTLYLGTLAALDTSGNVVAAADTAGLRARGRIEETVDNSAGLAGALTVKVKRGVFLFDNSATNAITAAMVGKIAYVEDNQTVASTTTNKVVAGRIEAVVTAGVWVDTRTKAIAAAAATTVGAAVATTAATAVSPYGYTQAQADAIIANLNALRVDVLALAAQLNG